MEYLIIVNDLDKKRIIKKVSEFPKLFTGKIMGYQEFIKKFFFDYDEETIFYVAEKYQVTKEIAEIYIQNLYFLSFKKTENKKINFLTKLYQELQENNKLQIHYLWKEKLKKQKIIFYHITKKDKMYHKLKKKCQQLTEVEVIDNTSKTQTSHTVLECPTIEIEVQNICSEICQKIKEGHRPSEIYLTNLTENYRNFFKTYGPIFHLPFSLKNKNNINSTTIVTDFVENYDLGIPSSLEKLKRKYPKPEEQEIIEWIVSICNRYAFIKNEERKKSFILEDLKKESPKKTIDTNAIQEIDFYEQEIKEEDIIFLVGANEGIFPHIYKEEEYLNDQERQELEIDTTEEKNKLAKEICREKLLCFKNIHISYAKKDGNIELYPTSILETIDYQKKYLKETFTHSHLFNQIRLGEKLDTLRKYGTQEETLSLLQTTYPSLPYNSYQNQYYPFKIEKKIPLTLSYTSLDTYFHCAFRYYLDNILKLNSYEETFDAKVGTLFHQILKEYYEPNFDFDTSWEKNIQGIPFENAKEKFFLNKLKKDAKRIITTLKSQEEQKNFHVLAEHNINYELNNSEIILKGIIDKIYWKKEENETLISMIDYKTGNPNINLDYLGYGINMQLPIYLLLLKKLPFQNMKIIGFYLQKILPTIPERDSIHTEEELKQKKLMLQGYSIDLESRLMKFDPTYENSKLIQGLKKSSKGFYAYSKILSEEQFSKLEQIALENINRALKQIEANIFSINPIRIGNKLIGCDYCKYQSICYRKEENIRNVKETKLNELLGGE